MKLGKVLKFGLAKRVKIKDQEEYVIAGVQSYGKGIVNRRVEKGSTMRMKEYQLIEPDFLMWCKVDTKNGAFGVTKSEHNGSITSTNMCLAKINKEIILPEFLERLFRFKSFHSYITHLSSGSTNRKYLTPKQLSELVKLPDFEIGQQKKFIELADSIESLGLIEEIDYQLLTIQQLRQAFLREAMQGKLVPQDVNDEPASVLLEHIKAEKTKLISEGKLKKEKPLPPIKSEEIPYEIPENWVWCRLGEIASVVRGGSPRPAGDNRFYNGAIPFLKVADLTAEENIFLSSHTFTIKEAGLSKTRYVEANTLLLTNSGATLGIPKICTFPTTFNDGIAAFLNLDNINKIFCFYFLKNITQWFLSEASKGQGQPNLNTDIIANTIIPIPPLAEQQQIVSKVDELMRYCDELEQNVKTSKEQTEMLLQVVLKEALAGN